MVRRSVSILLPYSFSLSRHLLPIVLDADAQVAPLRCMSHIASFSSAFLLLTLGSEPPPPPLSISHSPQVFIFGSSREDGQAARVLAKSLDCYWHRKVTGGRSVAGHPGRLSANRSRSYLLGTSSSFLLLFHIKSSITELHICSPKNQYPSRYCQSKRPAATSVPGYHR